MSKYVLLLGWLLASSVAALEIKRLVGTGDLLPEMPAGSRVVAALSPHVGGNHILFFAEILVPPDGPVVHGLWLWDGVAFHRVVDSTMPDGQAGFLGGLLYDVDETGLVAVNIESHAMIAWQDGVLHQVVVDGEPAPNAPPGSVFESFSEPVVDGGVVYFLGGLTGVPWDQRVHMYRWSPAAGLEEIILPGLCCFATPIPTPERVEFIGATDPDDPFGEQAIWRRSPDGELTQYFRLDSPTPGAPVGTYWIMDHTRLGVVSDGIVVKGGDNLLTVHGIFRIAPGTVEPVLLEGQLLPGTSHPVVGFRPEYSASGDRIAFYALANVGPSPGFFPGGVVLQDAYRRLHPVVYGGDILEGQQVFSSSTSSGALSGDTLAIDVQRGDDVAVWVADLSDLGDSPPNPLEVPTLPRAGLVALIVLLALAGALRVRFSNR